MDGFASAFGALVRSLRLARGLSQEEVAHSAGIHVTYLSGVERGKRNPSLKNLRRIAGALAVGVGELFSIGEIISYFACQRSLPSIRRGTSLSSYGLQDGCDSSPGELVSQTWLEPSAFITNISALPSTSYTKAMRVPSEDQVGA